MYIINERIFREGETDPAGEFTVERIDPDGVILRLTKGGGREMLKIEEVKGR